MAQQSPSFNMNRLSSADRILLVATALFFIDTFLPWQRACVSLAGFSACGSFSAWGGRAAALGVIAALFSIALLAWLVMNALGMNLSTGMAPSRLSSILVGGTVVFGVLKFILAATDHGGYGAWIGLILLIAIGYGGYMKMQEPQPVVAPPPAPPVPPA
jgi:hypothetical protein